MVREGDCTYSASERAQVMLRTFRRMPGINQLTEGYSMSNLYVYSANGNVAQIASGSPAAVVRAARETLARLTSDAIAEDMFGVRGFTAKGSVSASTLERLFAAGLRQGTGFATGTADAIVCAADSVDAALELITDMRIMLECGAAALA